MAALIGALRVTLGMDTADFVKGTKSARAQMTGLQRSMAGLTTTLKGIGAGLVAGLGVQALGDAVGRALEYTASLGEVAQQLGVTTSELQRYRYIATQVGIEQQEMDKGLSFLSKSLGDLAIGAKAPAKALSELGFNAGEIQRISHMTAGEAIPLLADAFKNLNNETKASALAADLFGGKLGPKFLSMLKGGSAGINELSAAYKKLGIEMSAEDIKRADEAMDKWAQWKSVISANLAKVSVEVLDWLNKAGASLDKWSLAYGSAVERYYARVAANFRGFVQTMESVGAAALNWPQKLATAINTWLVNRLNQAWSWVKGQIQSVGEKFKWLYDVVVGHSYIPDMVNEIGAHMRRLDAQMVQPARTAAEQTAESMRGLQSLLAELFPESAEANEFLGKLEDLDDHLRTGRLNAELYRAALGRLMFGREQAELIGGERDLGSMPELNPDNVREVSDAFDELGGNINNVVEHGLKGLMRGFGSLKDIALNVLFAIGDALITNLMGSSAGGGSGGIGGSIAAALGSIFGKGGGGTPGFARGGSFTVDGRGGTDRNTLSLNGRPVARVSRGERVKVDAQNDNKGERVDVFVTASEEFDVKVARTAGAVVSAAAPGIAARARGDMLRDLKRRRMP